MASRQDPHGSILENLMVAGSRSRQQLAVASSIVIDDNVRTGWQESCNPSFLQTCSAVGEPRHPCPPITLPVSPPLTGRQPPLSFARRPCPAASAGSPLAWQRTAESLFHASVRFGSAGRATSTSVSRRGTHARNVARGTGEQKVGDHTHGLQSTFLFTLIRKFLHSNRFF